MLPGAEAEPVADLVCMFAAQESERSEALKTGTDGSTLKQGAVTDMAQRSVIIKVVKGKNDGPWWEQTQQFINDHREKIIGDIIAALRAEPFKLAEFTRWATWEQHVLCRLPDPVEAQRLILERQGEANCELDEAEIIEEHFAEQLRRYGYESQTAQVRIPVAVAARWFGLAIGEQTKTAAASI